MTLKTSNCFLVCFIGKVFNVVVVVVVFLIKLYIFFFILLTSPDFLAGKPQQRRPITAVP